MSADWAAKSIRYSLFLSTALLPAWSPVVSLIQPIVAHKDLQLKEHQFVNETTAQFLEFYSTRVGTSSWDPRSAKSLKSKVEIRRFASLGRECMPSRLSGRVH